MEKSGKLYLSIFAVLGIVMLGLFLMTSFPVTTATSEDSTISNVSVAVSIGFTFSTNLSNGISFSSVNPGTTDNNATGDYNIYPENTTYYITMDSANNIGADTCILAGSDLDSGGANAIGIQNMTYFANSTQNGANMNTPTSSIELTTGYVKFGDPNVVADSSQYSQYWLDIPAGQASGNYNNTISYKIISTGGSC